MKRNLKSIAMKLTDSDIQELIRLRKQGDKKTVALRKKRDKLAAELARVDAQLAKAGVEIDAGEAQPAPRGRKPRGRPASTAKKAATKTSASGRKGRKPRTNLSAAVREVFARAGGPLKASQVVDGLPEAGIKVKSVPEMRKRISVVLASQKNYFEQVERGVYQLRS